MVDFQKISEARSVIIFFMQYKGFHDAYWKTKEKPNTEFNVSSPDRSTEEYDVRYVKFIKVGNKLKF